MDAPTTSVGDWLAQLDAAGWTDGVCVTLWLAARAAAARTLVRRGTLGLDRDDLAHEVFLVARSTTTLRGFRPDVPLVAWCGGVARNVVRHRAREVRGSGAAPRDAAAVPPAQKRSRSPPPRISPEELARRMCLLTPAERASVEAAAQGRSHRQAAKLLGITRQAHSDALRRAARRLETGIAPERNAPRTWIASLAKQRLRVGDVRNAAVLQSYAEGWRLDVIAHRTGLTRGAVSQRLHRLLRGEPVERP